MKFGKRQKKDHGRRPRRARSRPRRRPVRPSRPSLASAGRRSPQLDAPADVAARCAAARAGQSRRSRRPTPSREPDVRRPGAASRSRRSPSRPRREPEPFASPSPPSTTSRVVEGEAFELFTDEPAGRPPETLHVHQHHTRPRPPPEPMPFPVAEQPVAVVSPGAAAGAGDDARRRRRRRSPPATPPGRATDPVARTGLAGARDGARQRAPRARRRCRIRRWPAGCHDPSAPWQLRAPHTTWPRRSRRSASASRCSSTRRSSSPRPRSPRRSPSSCAGSSSASRRASSSSSACCSLLHGFAWLAWYVAAGRQRRVLLGLLRRRRPAVPDGRPRRLPRGEVLQGEHAAGAEDGDRRGGQDPQTLKFRKKKR